MSHPSEHHQPLEPKPARPVDVDTGFWLWVLALPLLTVGYVVGVVTGADRSGLLIAISSVFIFTLVSLVVTFLFLMRSGYRWARTVLTAGGLASIISVVTDLFAAERPTVAAVVFAVTGIIGAVLIAGGIYQLHRKDAQEFFTR
jgi:MFS family permease